MEAGFIKADSANLPIVDVIMVANFFANNPDFCATEFRNVKNFVSEYQSSLAKMFKIPDFDDDVPTTNLNCNKTATIPTRKQAKYSRLAESKADCKHKRKLMVKDKQNEKTANNSIVKSKDKIKKAKKVSQVELQNNIQFKNNISKYSNIQETREINCNKTKHRVNKSENCLKATEPHGNINKKKKSKTGSVGRVELQKNVQFKKDTSKYPNIQETKENNCSKTKNRVDKSENSLDTTEPHGNINKNKKSKTFHEPGAEWLQTDCVVTDSMVKKKKKKQKHQLEEFDEELLKASKKRLSKAITRDDQEAQFLFISNKPLTKKEKLRNMLMGQSSHRSPIKVNSSLRERMLEKLRTAQFRYLNEKLYTSSGAEARALFGADPAAFRAYHAGYARQLRQWPLNPLHLVAQRVRSFPKSYVVADMGCGEGALASLVPQTVRGFDLLAAAPGVTACDMARTPLPAGAADVAVYCLALMGTSLTDYLLEANRILRVGGHLLIAEVESRFDSVDQFARGVARLGFRAARLDRSHRLFYFLEFVKTAAPPARASKLPQLTLKPCLYKKR